MEDKIMPSLPTLPLEVLHSILTDVDPLDLYSLSLTCKFLHKFIGDNKLLFKELYLQRLDEPLVFRQPNPPDYDFKGELHKLVKIQRILEDREPDCNQRKIPAIPFIGEAVTELVRNGCPRGPSRNVKFLTKQFDSRKNQEAFLCQSITFARSKLRHYAPILRSDETRQMSAKMHCLFGVPIEAPRRTRFSSPYPYAASMVYDLRNYTDHTFWGPFRDDGLATVDWEKLEAVMIVLGYNLRIFTDDTRGLFKPLWVTPWVGAAPDSFKSIKLQKDLDAPAPPLNDKDPYNISGTYMRVVCFLDFNELFAYNFTSDQPKANEPRPPIDTTEVIRLIVMEVRITKIEPAGEDDHPDHPVVYFKGTSRSMHTSWDPNANSNIRGTVRVTKEGEVRWTTVSVYGGEERWKSEGIQIGGIGSARGVFGHWFDKDFDIHGPAGPTAFWKVSNEIDEEGGDTTLFDDDDEDDEDFVESDEDDEGSDDGDGRPNMVFPHFQNPVYTVNDEDDVWPGAPLPQNY